MEREEKISIGATELQAMIKTIMEEARKPLPPTEKELAKMAEEQALRAQQGALVRLNAQNRKNHQRLCSHLRRDGSTRAVFVQDDLGGYMLCQGCQDRIRPELADAQRKLDAPNTNYNSDMFNRLFQAAQPSIIG
jgi:hypothetical protein